MDGSSEQHFSDQEADAIIKRAVELQVQQAAEKAGSEGSTTLQQLYKSAAELGIDPSNVLQAVGEVSGRKTKPSKSIVGEPRFDERSFALRLTEADYPDLMEYLRATTKTQGTGHVIGGTLEWTGFSLATRETVHVAVVPKETGTTVRVRTANFMAGIPTGQGPRNLLFALPIVIGTLVFIGLASDLNHLAPMIIPALFILAIFALIPFLPSLIFRLAYRKPNRSPGGRPVIDSIANWMEHRSAQRSDPS